MTAPTPERRVGEADVKVWAEEAVVLGGSRQALWLNQRNELARSVVSLTAEVERLTKLVNRAVEVLHGEGLFVTAGEFAAALSLPTPAPEATDG